ncbi:PPC domain-containing protein [Phormidium pseudopriestleyi FRX01]|uniref:PPC domain-containing protein n=1 Tax=Phormidium pseudopriestleyi FRX01 TaxID=1759528 RepID=A0ABS3FV97_9CYAN|nr:PPC domain-containing protein [Phormidium pseudopriestleyi]MBO0351006.1 PPC domain-containing protein [Phormidium pseudopriestleyi FRX01]
MAMILAVSGIMFAVAISHDAEAQSQQALIPGRSTRGVLNSTSSQLRSEGGAQLLANDYHFEAQSGDELKIWIQHQGNLDLKLVLIDPFNNRIVIEDNDNKLQLGVTAPRLQSPGTYIIRVLSVGNKEGNYVIKIEASNPDRSLPADYVMRDQNLTIVPCGNPELATIRIGTETRCTSDIKKGGQHVYNPTTGTIDPVSAEPQPESLRDRLAREFGMQWTACGGRGLAEITIDGQTVCSRNYPEGKYTYNATTNRFDEVQVADRNLAKLEEWGLKPVECRSSGVVSILMDGKEYCTQPSDWLNVGNYRYIASDDRLEPIAQTPLPQPSNTNTNRNPNVQPDNGSGL